MQKVVGFDRHSCVDILERAKIKIVDFQAARKRQPLNIEESAGPFRYEYVSVSHVLGAKLPDGSPDPRFRSPIFPIWMQQPISLTIGTNSTFISIGQIRLPHFCWRVWSAASVSRSCHDTQIDSYNGFLDQSGFLCGTWKLRQLELGNSGSRIILARAVASCIGREAKSISLWICVIRKRGQLGKGVKKGSSLRLTFLLSFLYIMTP